jgi:CRISPR-associated endonuclease Cas3-HD
VMCSGSPNSQRQQLWAKTKWDNTSSRPADCRYHPLLYHMLDVAAVAGPVWDHCLMPQLRKRVERSIGIHSRTEIVFLSGAHDLGKASPGFQKKVPALTQLSELQFSDNDQNRPHGFITAHILKEALGSGLTSVLLGQIAGGHHGVFPRSAELRMGRDTLGNNCWKTARQELAQKIDPCPAYWARLEKHFFALLEHLPNDWDTAGDDWKPDDPQSATNTWRYHVKQEAEQALKESVRSLGTTARAIQAVARSARIYDSHLEPPQQKPITTKGKRKGGKKK